MTTFREITFSINGRPRTLYIDMRKSLLEVLRQDLGLTGAKQGCGVGECGACSVLVDEVLVDSCIYLAIWADNKNIRTIEGEAKNGKLSRVQQAYVDEGAVQCGFCTPGFIMATTSFTQKCTGEKITEDEIRKSHAGNLCRCTGYQNILKAVEKSIHPDKE
ncbi:MAG: (2Fe-2S)-binding protein [Deltaproteobacteria bacterium]|uniref:xanthine dehydrogenase subunit XdhC n=1 Tax=Desulfobacula sp. TaxID=2593537 RepID=UPI0019BE86E3|nr:(2Fe-2S)-binding protein [Candidatus Desulfobacula maris]MBL6993881.1 (2Fe-2S)-binding protein [Desulfobacula sp.]